MEGEMEHAIDASVNVSKALTCLKGSGVETIIRYYNRNMTAKVIRSAEFNTILAAGLSLCIVHQRGGRDPKEYGAQNGALDAKHCRTYGASLGQPATSAIYFSVDFDILKADLDRMVVPYFKAVRAEMANGAALPKYRIGVYGSGLTCKTLLDQGLVDFTWLSQSRKFQGTPEFRASNRWNLLQLLDDTVCGINLDPDIVNPAKPDFGQFSAAGAFTSTAKPATSAQLRVNARNGLHLRSGPGTGFDTIRTLDDGTIVVEIRRDGEWSFVDLEGDGKMDGAVFNPFLTPV
jgi:hypothetical protein